MEKSELEKRNPILLIGIGIFGGLAIASFAFLFSRIAKDTSFHLELKPLVTEIISESVDFGTYIIGILILIKVIKSSYSSELKTFIFSILLTIAAQVLQFFQPMIFSKFTSEAYLESSRAYRDFMNENIEYYSISIGSWIVLYVIVGLIIYFKRK